MTKNDTASNVSGADAKTERKNSNKDPIKAKPAESQTKDGKNEPKGSDGETTKSKEANQDSSPETSTDGRNTGKTYTRGENQKPVTDAYRNNWNDIFKRKRKKNN